MDLAVTASQYAWPRRQSGGSEHQCFAVIQKKSAQIAGAAAARDRSQDSNRKPLLVRFGMFAEIEDFAGAVKHLLR